MAEPQPQGQKETLAGEYRALRPDSSWDAATVEELRRSVHQQERPLSALCISGGGIRSATFALGALQGLAEQGLLGQVDYLSTVSGGGYIGGWLTAWAHRIGGLARLVPKLRRDAPPPGPGEPDPIQHLREYNNYLSPKLGSFSTDVWTLVATVLRNILLNWMVLVPMMIFAVMVPRFFVWLLSFPELKYGAEIFHGSEPDYAVPVLDAVSGSPWVHYVLPLVSSLLLAVAFFHIVRCLPGIGGRDHSRREYRRFILLPLVGAVFTFLMFDSLYYLGSKFAHYSNLLSVVAWTSLPVLVAWLAYLAVSGLPWRRRLGLLFGAPSFAVLSMATGLGVATWVSTNFLLSSPNPETSPSWAEYVTFGPSVVLLGFCLGTVLFTGLSSSFLADPDREWLSRATAGVLLFSVAWSGLCFLALVAPHWVLAWRGWQSSLLAGVGAVSAWLSSQAGGLAARGADGEGSGKTTKVVAAVATKLAPPLFLAVLAIGLSILVDILLVVAHRATGLPFAGPHGEPIAWWQHYSVLTRSHPALLTLLAATLLALGWFMARYINVNTFSLHGMYRDRLIRAYLGASNPERNASRFTGFAPNDDLPMASVAPIHGTTTNRIDV
nr:patatin-like phospholipase family protein [Thermoanaerobaculia bacterium]